MTRLRKCCAYLLALVSIAALATAARADFEYVYPALNDIPPVGPGYQYYYDSFVQEPTDSFPVFYYYWELDNSSSDKGIMSWTWAGGNVFDLGDYTSPDGPLPWGPADTTELFGFSDTTSDAGPVTVQSTIRFSDQHEEIVPIYVPRTVVPEPSALIAMLGGLSSLGLLRRKRA
ncbi:MAG: PEP-CTERM sorting domain-containing protein [Armatimonadetes bacterium]|nr:PEP-CTERM sorting domain-containing protein [Armatimonadota bacterium]